MRTIRMKVITMLAACVSLLTGVHVLAQTNKACTNFMLGCQGYNCTTVGKATCTDDNNKSQTWNRLTQNGGTGYQIGSCNGGMGNCSTKSFDCNADKYYNANDADSICNDTTLKCHDDGTTSGCKDS